MEDKPTSEVATKLDGSHAAFTVFTSALQTAGTVLGTRCNPAQTERTQLRLSAFEMNFVRGLVSVWQKCLRLETSWWKLRKGSYLFIYLFCCLCFEQTHFNSLFSPFFSFFLISLLRFLPNFDCWSQSAMICKLLCAVNVFDYVYNDLLTVTLFIRVVFCTCCT